MIGLSPAYFISRFTDEFTPSDVAKSLTEISEMGYSGFQLEVYHRKHLKLWLEGGSARVRQRADDLGLKPTQFVAHFMMSAFANPDNLNSDLGLTEMQAVNAADYRGSFDLEIVCQPEAVRQQYSEGRAYIERLKANI